MPAGRASSLADWRYSPASTHPSASAAASSLASRSAARRAAAVFSPYTAEGAAHTPTPQTAAPGGSRAGLPSPPSKHVLSPAAVPANVGGVKALSSKIAARSSSSSRAVRQASPSAWRRFVIAARASLTTVCTIVPHSSGCSTISSGAEAAGDPSAVPDCIAAAWPVLPPLPDSDTPRMVRLPCAPALPQRKRLNTSERSTSTQDLSSTNVVLRSVRCSCGCARGSLVLGTRPAWYHRHKNCWLPSPPRRRTRSLTRHSRKWRGSRLAPTQLSTLCALTPALMDSCPMASAAISAAAMAGLQISTSPSSYSSSLAHPCSTTNRSTALWPSLSRAPSSTEGCSASSTAIAGDAARCKGRAPSRPITVSIAPASSSSRAMSKWP